MFLSAVWTLILTAPIHCRGSTGEQVSYCYLGFLHICSDEETNSSTSWMAWRWVHFKQIFIFGRTIPLTIIISGLEGKNKMLPNVKYVYIKAFSRHFELVDTDLSVSPWDVWPQVINKLIQYRVEAFTTPVFHSQISQTCRTKHWKIGLNTQQLKLEDTLRSKECDCTSVSPVNELMGWAAVVHN